HALKDEYTAVVNRIIELQHYDRYEGAFVFGSYVTDDLQETSDLDVVVLVIDEESCPEVSHPRVNGIPLDVSFNSFARIQQYIHQTLAQGFRRKPWLYDSQILFDKKGQDALSLNAFIYRARGVLIGYFLCGQCAAKIHEAAAINPGKQIPLHTVIERNLVQAYRRHLH
ncbi:MAG: nucleotidyltransferase domain-containing protein, partial [Caldilineaceae bacterium]|nr:nucleotidyltransferase domain-containing protein [Caldilineaceae bacterium]